MMSWRALGLAALLVPGPLPLGAQEEDFDRFVRFIGPLCATAPSTVCVDAAFAHADADADGTLTLEELERVREDLRAWSRVAGPTLTPVERNGIALGLMVVDSLGLALLFASYDTDGDGRLTKEELLADVRLDERPLGEVVTDRDSLDWPSLRQRLGFLSGLVEPLAPPDDAAQ